MLCQRCGVFPFWQLSRRSLMSCPSLVVFNAILARMRERRDEKRTKTVPAPQGPTPSLSSRQTAMRSGRDRAARPKGFLKPFPTGRYDCRVRGRLPASTSDRISLQGGGSF